MQRYPINPLPFSGGSILLLDGGRCIIQLDPLPEDAPDAVRDYCNRYLATLADLGHVAYVGTPAQFALVRSATHDKKL